MTPENIIQRVCVVESPETQEKGPEEAAGKELSERLTNQKTVVSQ